MLVIHMYAYVYNMSSTIDMSTHIVHVCLYVCMSVCLCVCMSVCLYVCMSVCLYVCMSACLYVCMRMYIYIYIYICVCIFAGPPMHSSLSTSIVHHPTYLPNMGSNPWKTPFISARMSSNRHDSLQTLLQRAVSYSEMLILRIQYLHCMCTMCINPPCPKGIENAVNQNGPNYEFLVR